MKYLLLFGLVILLCSCGTPEESTSAPTPEAIKIIYPPVLQAWADGLSSCASDNPQVALYFIQANKQGLVIHPNEIRMELGEPDSIYASAYVSQVGWEQIVVVVNKDNSLTQLSGDTLQIIFSGQVSTAENDPDQFFQVWVLPEGEPTRMLFDRAVLQTFSLTADAMLAPDTGAMLAAISQNGDAIGYLSESILNTSSNTSKVKIVQLEPSFEEQLHQPVVAVTQSEPSGSLRSLLVCLESKSH